MTMIMMIRSDAIPAHFFVILRNSLKCLIITFLGSLSLIIRDPLILESLDADLWRWCKVD
jgi:hypothetical protein